MREPYMAAESVRTVHTTSRPVNLREAYQKLKLTFGEETADRLTGRSGLWKEFRDALAQQKTT